MFYSVIMWKAFSTVAYLAYLQDKLQQIYPKAHTMQCSKKYTKTQELHLRPYMSHWTNKNKSPLEKYWTSSFGRVTRESLFCLKRTWKYNEVCRTASVQTVVCHNIKTISKQKQYTNNTLHLIYLWTQETKTDVFDKKNKQTKHSIAAESAQNHCQAWKRPQCLAPKDLAILQPLNWPWTPLFTRVFQVKPGRNSDNNPKHRSKSISGWLKKKKNQEMASSKLRSQLKWNGTTGLKESCA